MRSTTITVLALVAVLMVVAGAVSHRLRRHQPATHVQAEAGAVAQPECCVLDTVDDRTNGAATR